MGEKAVIVMVERIQGGNCSRRRMTIPLSPVYRMNEKDKDRGILEIFRENEQERLSERV